MTLARGRRAKNKMKREKEEETREDVVRKDEQGQPARMATERSAGILPFNIPFHSKPTLEKFNRRYFSRI